MPTRLVIVNKRDDWKFTYLPFIGNYDRSTDRQTNQPANQQTDMSVHRDVILPIRKTIYLLLHLYDLLTKYTYLRVLALLSVFLGHQTT